MSAVTRLTELRLTVLEERLDLELQLGRHLSAVPVLEEVVAAHPLRERLRALLMLALPKVNMCMSLLPDCRKKTAIRLSVEAYADAGRAWAVMSKGPQSDAKRFPAMAKLLKDRYAAPPEILHAFVRGEHLPVLTHLWVRSHVYLAFAT